MILNDRSLAFTSIDVDQIEVQKMQIQNQSNKSDEQMLSDCFKGSQSGQKKSKQKYYDCDIFNLPQYEPFIKTRLLKIAMKKYDDSKNYIERTLLKFNYFSNGRRADSMNGIRECADISALETSFKSQQHKAEFFSKIAGYILKMQDRFLNKESRQKKVVNLFIVRSNVQACYQIPKNLILFLMCLMSFNLVKKQSTRLNLGNYVGNFSLIFKNQQYKSRCIKAYFKDAFQYQQEGCIKIQRLVSYGTMKQLCHALGHKKLSRLRIVPDNSDMQDEEFKNYIKVDFANKNIGGGALDSGSVQQQIMFANRPELYTTMLFCQTMQDNQAICFTGFKKVAKNTGYSRQVTYAGRQTIKYEKNQDGTIKDYIVAIDALSFSNYDKQTTQYSSSSIDRQIFKAFTGFKFSPEMKNMNIVSGNWGCGAFNGDPKLKLLIQWIAASMAEKDLIYCPYGKRSEIDYKEMLKIFKGQTTSRTIEQAYILLKEAAKMKKTNMRSNDESGIYGKLWQIQERQILQADWKQQKERQKIQKESKKQQAQREQQKDKQGISKASKKQQAESKQQKQIQQLKKRQAQKNKNKNPVNFEQKSENSLIYQKDEEKSPLNSEKIVNSLDSPSTASNSCELVQISKMNPYKKPDEK